MLLSFIVTTWLLAMLPGVGQALMLRQTLAHGPRVAIATIVGTATGLLIWAAAAGAGLSAALLADPAVYRVLTLAGGAFLGYMGLRTLWAARRGTTGVPPDADVPVPDSRWGAYLAGLATNLANPKAGVFAISLLPTFAGASVGSFWPTLGLGAVWSAVTAAWYIVFVALVSRGRSFVSRPATHRTVSVASGVVLVGVGTAVALGL
ncbi:LysE family translocator [Intrasporangium mesophilum]